MSEELIVLKMVAQSLDAADIIYMISGSMAANYYTIPRMTRDIDVVIELRMDGLARFTSAFDRAFYVDSQMIAEEIRRCGMFNLIHNEYLLKVDFIIRKSSDFENAALARRCRVIIQGTPVWLISLEDLILAKLLWAEDSHSEIQLKDVRNLLRTAEDLDSVYVDGWVRRLGLEALFNEVRA